MSIPCPKGFNYDPHQIDAIKYIDETPGNIIVADEMGKGKTVSVIGYLNYKRINQALIIPKATGVAVWAGHLKDWHVMRPRVSEYHPDEPFFETQILIAHYHWFSYVECAAEILRHFPYRVVILDEAHTIRKGASSRGRKLYSKNGICAKAEKVIAATGTPLFNKVEGLYPLIKGIRPDAIDHMTKHEFGVKYCAGFIDKDGKWNYSGASNVEELAAKLANTCMIRRTEVDAPTELPKLHKPVVVYLKQNKKRRELIEQIEIEFGENFKIDRNVYNDDNEELATLRRHLGESKITEAARFILSKAKRSRKIVVFAYHRSVVKELHNIIEEHVTCHKLIGGMSKKKAAYTIEHFQKEPGPQVIVCSFAYSDTITLHASSLPIFVELSYIWNENKQAIKRVHRRGQSKEVRPVFLAFRDSYDQRLLKINFDKIKTDRQFESGRGRLNEKNN